MCFIWLFCIRVCLTAFQTAFQYVTFCDVKFVLCFVLLLSAVGTALSKNQWLNLHIYSLSVTIRSRKRFVLQRHLLIEK